MSDAERREITIADVLTGRTHVTPLMRITPGQRLYDNYRFHQLSFDREIVSARSRHEHRDVRFQREREHDTHD
jgi:hypothetical protein